MVLKTAQASRASSSLSPNKWMWIFQYKLREKPRQVCFVFRSPQAVHGQGGFLHNAALLLQTRGSSGPCWALIARGWQQGGLCALDAVFGGLACGALVRAPGQAALPPAPAPSGRTGALGTLVPSTPSSCQRGLSSTEGDSLSYSPESGA